jgi:hypothetical protein
MDEGSLETKGSAIIQHIDPTPVLSLQLNTQMKSFPQRPNAVELVGAHIGQGSFPFGGGDFLKGVLVGHLKT